MFFRKNKFVKYVAELNETAQKFYPHLSFGIAEFEPVKGISESLVLVEKSTGMKRECDLLYRSTTTLPRVIVLNNATKTRIKNSINQFIVTIIENEIKEKLIETCGRDIADHFPANQCVSESAEIGYYNKTNMYSLSLDNIDFKRAVIYLNSIEGKVEYFDEYKKYVFDEFRRYAKGDVTTDEPRISIELYENWEARHIESEKGKLHEEEMLKKATGIDKYLAEVNKK